MTLKFINACKTNDMDTIQEMPPDIDINTRDDCFIVACKVGNVDVMKYLIELGVDIHTTIEAGFRLACMNGHIDVVKYLVLNQDFKDCNAHGFRNACWYGRIDVVKYLVLINKDTIDEEGFRLACMNGRIDIVRYIVENTNINIHGRRGANLRGAYLNGHIDIVQYLVTLQQCAKYRKNNKTRCVIANINVNDYSYRHSNKYINNLGSYNYNNKFIL